MSCCDRGLASRPVLLLTSSDSVDIGIDMLWIRRIVWLNRNGALMRFGWFLGRSRASQIALWSKTGPRGSP